MKKILSMLFAATAIGFGATSCSDFLEEDNKTGETADLVYMEEVEQIIPLCLIKLNWMKLFLILLLR